ncbi:TIM-barrel domain-containing protein [Prolixibacter denitrificans]|uniref:Alpha-D-xyloside xylohydrolase n=1 Tax=Prolixibacter denitrificans TaxID=1541063 RepID=A0A2P8CBR6_9BACT|nr:TIM-barrel domain-containing protein [Prolixibacter denitrificans]PSK82411.1 alpha-D-xyloside xylohydrolase [Prolixibacter denitrificans]GET22845.1 alpha-xylosidase [Prolixibacter denitrificans]
MKGKNIYLSLLLGLLFASCSSTQYQKLNDGILLNLHQKGKTATHKVRLQVLGDELFHVSATPDKNFPKDSSLIIFPGLKTVPFTVEDEGDSIRLSTSKLNVMISKADGGIKFKDKEGKLILAEKKGGGRTFTPIDVDGTKGYTIRQLFDSPADEAFYGLGQHQSDEFNYKGKSEQLFQYNTKVSVPFIVSNKNYGLLWDSYSLSRFGDSRAYQQLNRAFKLYDENGKPGGLTGTYVSLTKARPNLVRTEDSLYFEDIKTVKNLPENFPLKNAHVTYTGEIEAPHSGTYRLILYYAGYVKVYVDNKLVVPERWRTAWNPNSYKFTVKLDAGKRVPIRVDWKPDGGKSYCGLQVETPLPKDEQNSQVWWSEMNKKMDYYFVYGKSMDEVIKGYRTLTGKSQIMPKWAMGFWQSRERYKTQNQIVSTLKEFRKLKFPIDNIVLDWFYWPETKWGSHQFDKNRFPDPKAMVDSIHAMNAHMMISVWPKFYATTQHFKEFEKHGWMYMQAVKDSIRDWVGPGYVGSFYDAYSAGARKLFWKQMYDNLYPLGIDAWWMDASEPNILDCTDMKYRKELCGPTALGPSTEYFNAYALMNAEAIYNGQRGVAPNKRVFLLTRSGFAGLQHYSTATWSGDIATRWEDMKAQIAAGMNFSISGIPYWTMDIGGFCVEDRYVKGQMVYNRTGKVDADYKEWRELNTRWYQFGAFAPLYRAHGQYPYREPWNIAPKGTPTYNSILYYTQLRYRLMPYIYTLAGMTWFDDYTIMRPLVMDFPGDKNVEDIGDQYMFGPAFMVCPVYTYQARNRKVYFPKGTNWYNFYTGKMIQGGQSLTVNAPYNRMPLFVHEGSIIPVGPALQYSNEKLPKKIVLYVYRGQNGQFTLYEDEGVNYDYEKGAYSNIPFSYNEAKGTLIIGERKGQFKGMLKERTFVIVPVGKEKPKAFDPDVKGIEVNYDGHEQTIQL